MNCFNHPDVPAIGLCKYCQKGLCKDCVVDLGYGIACENHRVEVTALKEVHYSQGYSYLDEKSLQKTLMVYKTTSMIFLYVGIGMIAGGFLANTFERIILLIAGILFFGVSVMYSMDAKKLGKSMNK